MAPFAIPVKKNNGRKAIVWSSWKKAESLVRLKVRIACKDMYVARKSHAGSPQRHAWRTGDHNKKGAPKGSRQFLVRRKGFDPLTF